MAGALTALIASLGKGIPNAPTIGTATDVGTARAFNNGAATITFTPAGGVSATSFRATSSPGGFTATGSSSPLTVTGLQSGINYTFTVVAINAVGTSSNSSASNQITATTVPATPVISNLAGDDGQVAYTWTISSNGGKVLNQNFRSYATPGGAPNQILAYNTLSDTFVHNSLTNGTSYTFKIEVANANGYSAQSASSASVVPNPVKYFAQGHATSPYVSVYRYTDTAFGTKVTDPATLPSFAVAEMAFNPVGNHLVLSASGSSLEAYPFTSGFGTKYADSGSTGGVVTTAFHPSGTAVAAGHYGSPYLSVYPWSNGFGTKFANPSTLPPGRGDGVSFNRSGNAIAVTHYSEPRVSVYPWSNGFGTKFANPSALIQGQGNDVSFSSNDIAIASYNSPRIQVYPFSSGFGTKFANPAQEIGNNATSVAFNPASNLIAVGARWGASIHVYPWSGGFGTKFANPASWLNSNPNDIAWNSTGTVVGHAAADNIAVYPFSGGFGTRFANPSPSYAGSIQSLAFKS